METFLLVCAGRGQQMLRHASAQQPQWFHVEMLKYIIYIYFIWSLFRNIISEKIQNTSYGNFLCAMHESEWFVNDLNINQLFHVCLCSRVCLFCV